MNNYKSDIELGERYHDEQTGFEGVATAISFFQFACERVVLETYDVERKEIKAETFDVPRLISVKSGKVARTDKTGGPDRPVSRAKMPTR